MNLRAASFFLTLPALALLAAGCATTAPGTARSTEVDDVYFSSSDRMAPRRAANATPAYDPTAPPAADGSVANPDYNGQQGTANQNYYGGDAYTATPRVTSPYYGSFNQFNSGNVYDPFWTGSSLAIGCGPGWGGGWGGPSAFAYAPIWSGPRVRFGVSFGYGYGGWAGPMYGWAGPTFYDPFYDPFFGPSFGYSYGCGWGYPAYYGGWGNSWGWGGGWNGYRQGFNDGFYAGGGGVRSGRRVVYGPRLDRSGGGAAYSTTGGRTTRRSGDREITPGATGGGYQPAAYGGYGGGGVSRTTRATSMANSTSNYSPASAPSNSGYNYGGGATRTTRSQANSNVAPPIYQQPVPATRGQGQTMPVAPAPEQRGNWLQRTTRTLSEAAAAPSETRSTRTYSPPTRSYESGSSGGGSRSSGGGGGGGATRRSR
jgi:hypothetical protein